MPKHLAAQAVKILIIARTVRFVEKKSNVLSGWVAVARIATQLKDVGKNAAS